jgi:hypothetical protein
LKKSFKGVVMIRIGQITLFAMLLLGLQQHVIADARLDVDPVLQETPEWCWITAGQMVFTFFGVANLNPAGNFQCGIISLAAPACDKDCRKCASVPGGSLDRVHNMLMRYSQVASTRSHTSAQLTADTYSSPLSMDDVKTEINLQRPIIVGISPNGHPPPHGSEHVALIIGYDDQSDLIVNDPFPFNPSRNPYGAAGGKQIARGQYIISRDAFVSRLLWREGVDHIRCSGPDCRHRTSGNTSTASTNGGLLQGGRPEVGRTCQTPTIRCGPFYKQAQIPVGSPCHCGSPNGPINGKVVAP